MMAKSSVEKRAEGAELAGVGFCQMAARPKGPARPFEDSMIAAAGATCKWIHL